MTEKVNCSQHAAHEQRFKGIENLLEKFQENQSLIIDKLTTVTERVTAAEQSTRSAHHRLDDMKEHTEAVIRLAVSVETMASQMEKVVTKIEQHDEDLTTIKNQPAQQALKAYEWLKYTVSGGVIGLFFGYALWFLTNKK